MKMYVVEGQFQVFLTPALDENKLIPPKHLSLRLRLEAAERPGGDAEQKNPYPFWWCLKESSSRWLVNFRQNCVFILNLFSETRIRSGMDVWT